MTEIDDRELAVLLAARALVEIRYLAASAQQTPEENPPANALDRIRFLADLVHNMPLIAKPPTKRPTKRPTRGKAPNRRERAMEARPMSWTWNTCGHDGRAWITQHIEHAGRRWTPPPPLPTPRRGVPALSMRQRTDLLTGWPVKAPPGRQPLPRHAQVLKGLDSEAVLALYEEAGRLRLGLGKGGPWLRAHLDPTATHFLFPDPADYYWPGPDAGRRWWQCTVLLQMSDGEQVTGMLAVLPETFLALPSTVPRLHQRRLALIAQTTERDTYLLGRSHESDCDPQRCGYTPPGETSAPQADGSQPAS
jgi:hypothetical protein